MSNIRGVDHSVSVATAATTTSDDASRQAALDQLRNSIAQTERQREKAQQDAVNAATQLADTKKRAKLADTNPGRTNTRPVTAAELAIQAEQDATAQLKDLVNGDPHSPAIQNSFAKNATGKTPREIVNETVTQQQVVQVLNPNNTGLGQQTSAQQVAVTAQLQVDRASGQVVGGYIPPTTSTVVAYHVDPSYGRDTDKEFNRPQIQTGNVGANVTDAYGNPSNQVLTPEARLQYAQNATTPGAAHVSTTQTQAGVGHTDLREVAPPPIATPAFEHEFRMTTNPNAG